MYKQTFDVKTSTALKAIAVLMMLFHHCFLSQNLYQNYLVIFTPFTENTVVTVSNMFKICVSIFAFISGYGLYLNYSKTELTPVQWVVAREIKLLSGYWFAFIIINILLQITHGSPKKVYFSEGLWQGGINLIIDFFGASTLFSTATLTRTWWYMSAALVFVLLVPLLVYSKNQLILWSLLITILPRIFGTGYQGANAILSFIPAFILGIICSKYELLNIWINWKSNKRSRRWIKFCLELVALWISFKLYNRLPTELFWDWKWGIYPVLVIAFCIEYIVPIPILNSILVFIGKHSMNIFFIHIFIKNYYFTEWLWAFKHFILIAFMLLIISLLFSILMEGIKRYMKYNQLINRLSTYMLRSEKQ